MVRHPRKTYKARAHKPTKRHTLKVDQNAGGFWDKVKGVFRKKEKAPVLGNISEEHVVPKGNTPTKKMLTIKPKPLKISPLVKPAKLGLFARFGRKKSVKRSESNRPLLSRRKISNRRINRNSPTKPIDEFSVFVKLIYVNQLDNCINFITTWLNTNATSDKIKDMQDKYKIKDNNTICVSISPKILNELNTNPATYNEIFSRYQGQQHSSPIVVYQLYTTFLFAYMIWLEHNNPSEAETTQNFAAVKKYLQQPINKAYISKCIDKYQKIITEKHNSIYSDSLHAVKLLLTLERTTSGSYLDPVAN
jgi:hypothetical protein